MIIDIQTLKVSETPNLCVCVRTRVLHCCRERGNWSMRDRHEDSSLERRSIVIMGRCGVNGRWHITRIFCSSAARHKAAQSHHSSEDQINRCTFPPATEPPWDEGFFKVFLPGSDRSSFFRWGTNFFSRSTYLSGNCVSFHGSYSFIHQCCILSIYTHREEKHGRLRLEQFYERNRLSIKKCSTKIHLRK